MRSPHSALLGTVLLLSSLTSFALDKTAVPDRITKPIVPTARVQTNAVHPLATAKADVGRVASTQVFKRMVIQLSGSDTQKAALTKLLADQQDPKSASYHKWLSPTEFGEQFGPSTNDLAKVTAWLTSQGFAVEKPTNGRRFLLFTGTSSQVETAFQTEMHQYSISGKTYTANSKPASVPSALAPVVKGVTSLNSFQVSKSQLTLAKKPAALVGGDALVAPADLAAIYNATPLKAAGIQGDGQSIAVLEESNINPQDFADFRTLNGLPAGTLNVIVNGPDPGLLSGDGEESEAILDASWAGALAPNATINFVVTASTAFNQGIDLSTLYAVDFLVSPITSLSYGQCETVVNLSNGAAFYGAAFYGALYEQGAAEGISHFVSSGDYGGDNCYNTFPNAGFGVNGIGSSPYNVSVGGTEFIDPTFAVYFPPPTYTATGYIPERAWNDYPEFGAEFPLAGSGGVSINYLKPSWQAGPGVPDDDSRDVPDVSLLAGDHEAYLACQRDIGADCSQNIAAGFVGTSISTPNWAGIQALINQKNAVVGGSGNPNPTYYRLAAGTTSPFHDITVGDNKTPDVNGDPVGFATTVGYDLATGLGSVDVNAIVNAWSSPTGSGTPTVTLTTTATHITHGADLTANVAVTATGTTVPSGDAALIGASQGIVQVSLDNTGAASFSFGNDTSTGNALPGGTYNLTARYAGDTNFAPATSNAIPLTVDPEASTTKLFLESSTTTIPYGAAVSFEAYAIGGSGNTAGGTFTFTDGARTIGTAKTPLTGESFAPFAPVVANITLSASTLLPVGTHSITATFPGNASYLTSTSTPVTTIISKGTTVTSLLADHTAPAINTPINLTANVISNEGFGTNAPMTGTMTFYDGATPIGTATLPATFDANAALVVTLPATFTTAGLHTIQAVYSGDTNVFGGVSGIINVTVGGKSTTTSTISAQTFSLAGIATTVTAHVTGDSASPVPTGMVTFTDTDVTSGPGTVLGTSTLTNGTATLSVTSLIAGIHRITASYPGDANFTASVSTSTRIQTGDFTLTPATSTSTVTQGQTTSAITLTYAAPYSLASVAPGITFACSGLPTGAACNFSINPLLPTVSSTTGAGSGTTSLTITTTGPTLTKASLDRPGSLDRSSSPGGRTGLLAMAGLFAIGLPFALRRRRVLPTLFCLLLLATFGAISGCSSGGSTTTAPTQTTYLPTGGTTAGTSTVTVTATLAGGTTYGTLNHTVTVALTVASATPQ